MGAWGRWRVYVWNAESRREGEAVGRRFGSWEMYVSINSGRGGATGVASAWRDPSPTPLPVRGPSLSPTRGDSGVAVAVASAC